MSAVNVVRLDIYRDLAAIRSLLREATALGARFRLRGFDTEIDKFAALPGGLQTELEHYRETGLLWIYLGGEDRDEPSLDLAETLGVDIELVETRAAARRAVRTLINDAAKHTDDGAVGLDIETAPLPEFTERSWAVLTKNGSLAVRQPKIKSTAGLNPHTAKIASIQLYAGGEKCFVFRGEAMRLVRDSHWFRRQRLVAHNSAFEIKFLLHECVGYLPPPYRRNRGRIECTLQGAGLVHGVGHSGETRRLDRVARVRLGLDVPKELQVSDWDAPRLSPGQLAYAGSDAILAHRIWPGLRDEIATKNRWAPYELQRRASAAVAAMELSGVLVDLEEHTQHVAAWSRDLAIARQEYVALIGKPPPTKPNEIRAWLETVLSPQELAQWTHTKKAGLLSITKDDLGKLAHVESARPVIDIVNREKLLSSFGVKLAAKVNPITGRIYPSFHLAAAKAGRFSASDPNFQQMPTEKRAPGFRRCFRAAPGYVLIGCDFSQIELRALAFKSRNRALTEAFANGVDIHRTTAAGIAGVALDEVTDAQRQGAKPVNFGAIYGMKERGLVQYAFNTYGVALSLEEARRYLERFFATYAGLEGYLRDHANLCERRGYIEIGCGRVVEARWEKDGRISFQQCCNLPI